MYTKELKKLKELYEKGIFLPEFYSKKIKESSFNSYENFKKIPFTFKHEIRNSSVEQRTTTAAKDIYGVFSSSGTTGEKTFYIYNKKDKQIQEEFVRTFYTELGINEEDIGGVLAPVDNGVMAHTMMWQFTTMGAGYVNCPNPSPENIIDTITKVPVTVIATRPSIASSVVYNPYITEMAKKSHVKKLLMGGGFLSTERRKLLEKSWNADCYNMFGMSEMFGPMAGECKKKNGQHYLDEYLMIEIVNPTTGEPVDVGDIGVAVYTTLWDKGFPLLRYWTDDLMRLEFSQCECGSVNPRLFYKGRLNDCFVINGKYVFPENIENVLFKYGHYGEYLVEHTKENYVIKVESGDTFVSDDMLNELMMILGKKCSVNIIMPGSLNYDGHGKRFMEIEE